MTIKNNLPNSKSLEDKKSSHSSLPIIVVRSIEAGWFFVESPSLCLVLLSILFKSQALIPIEGI